MMYYSLRVFLFLLFSLSFFFLHWNLIMESIRVGSLNINGGRDRVKRALISEFIILNDVKVTFLQETHSDSNNELEWYRWWEGECKLSHGTNLSMGVAVLFSKHLDLKIVTTIEVEKGRVLLVIAEIKSVKFLFVNVYAPNIGWHREITYKKLNDAIKQYDDGNICVVIGGDWNCTTNFVLDRNGDEPHSKSSKLLLDITNNLKLVDVWRSRNELVKQYTWIKILDSVMTGARLDRLYISKSEINRVTNTNILPNGFSDHHMVTLDYNVVKMSRPKFYWHFNVKLLQDTDFYEKFCSFWEIWRQRKNNFENLTQWWEVGKA